MQPKQLPARISSIKIDWNGDDVVDQRISAPEGTPISHVFKDGQYQVKVTVIGNGTEYSFSELVSTQDSSSPTELTTEPSLNSTLTSDTVVGIGEAVTIEVANPTGEVVGIDWNGDGRVDQTVSGASVIQHFYQSAGAYEIFLFSGTGESFSSHTIFIESDEPLLTFENPPPTPLPLISD